MDEKIREAIMRELTVPLWPTAGRALGLGRSATYDAAKRGDIPTLSLSRRPRCARCSASRHHRPTAPPKQNAALSGRRLHFGAGR
jgi:hypothetical protein